MTNVEDTVNKEYIDKHEAYLLLKQKAETYMLPATKEAYEKAAILIDSMKTHKDNQEALEKRDKMMRDTVAELGEVKRLLKAAVEDIHELLCDKKDLGGSEQGCTICSYVEYCPCCEECTVREDLRNWRYADEALELIGKDDGRE